MFETMYRLLGADDTLRIMKEMESTSPEDVGAQIEEAVERVRYLVENDGDAVISTDDQNDLDHVGFALSLAYAKDDIVGAIMTKVILGTVYRMGMKAARLEVFKSAEVKE